MQLFPAVTNTFYKLLPLMIITILIMIEILLFSIFQEWPIKSRLQWNLKRMMLTLPVAKKMTESFGVQYSKDRRVKLTSLQNTFHNPIHINPIK